MSARDEALLQELIDTLREPILNRNNRKVVNSKPTSDEESKDVKKELSFRTAQIEGGKDSSLKERDGNSMTDEEFQKTIPVYDISKNDEDEATTPPTESDVIEPKLGQSAHDEESYTETIPSEGVSVAETVGNKATRDETLSENNDDDFKHESDTINENEAHDESDLDVNEVEDEESPQGQDEKDYLNDLKIQKLQNLLKVIE